MVVTFYMSSISSNMEIKKKQQKIDMILSSKKIEYETKDVSAPGVKEEMRRIVGCDKALPPQLCVGDQFIGDYDAFEAAVENETLMEFLKLK